jgi:hypothetical protein
MVPHGLCAFFKGGGVFRLPSFCMAEAFPAEAELDKLNHTGV